VQTPDLRSLPAFVDFCLRAATNGVHHVDDILPTLYICEADGGGFAPITHSPPVHDARQALHVALQDLAIDPDVDVYCAIYRVALRKPGMTPRDGLRVHAGKRGAAQGVVRFHPIGRGLEGGLVAAPALYWKDEESWFAGMKAVADA
jgi:hypothetical protein